VLAVLDALKLNKPVLVGHSIAGEELSSVGTRHPKTVAGLIYLEAVYSFSYYDCSRGDLNIDLQDLQRDLEQLQPGKEPPDRKPLLEHLLQASMPEFERDLQGVQNDLQTERVPLPSPPEPTAADRTSYQTFISWQKRAQGFSMPEGELRQIYVTTPQGHVGDLRTKATIGQAIVAGEQKYTDITVPVLAVFALPHALSPMANNEVAARVDAEARDMATTGARLKAFESRVPSARVVTLPHADHYVFISNELDVLREIHAFIASLH
jgi:pimeloyl-ACP methyl ester carboxylesterase